MVCFCVVAKVAQNIEHKTLTNFLGKALDLANESKNLNVHRANKDECNSNIPVPCYSTLCRSSCGAAKVLCA